MQQPTRRRWITLAVLAALGLWTIPTMLYPLGAVCLWIALAFLVEGRKDEWYRFAGALALGAAVTLLLYTPVFVSAGVAAVVANKVVASSPWPQFLSDMADTGWESLRSWGLGLSPLISGAFLLLAIRALSRHADLNRARVGLPLAVFVWCAWLLVVSHRAPFARVWLWLLPIAALLAGAGLVLTLESWPRTKDLVTKRLPLIAVIVAAATGTSLVLSRAVLRTRDTGTFVDAGRAAAILSSIVKHGDRVIAPLPDNGPLGYYLVRRGVDSTIMTLPLDSARRVYVTVNEDEGHTLDDVLQKTSRLKDTAQFSGRLVAELPTSAIVVFERKHVSPK